MKNNIKNNDKNTEILQEYKFKTVGEILNDYCNNDSENKKDVNYEPNKKPTQINRSKNTQKKNRKISFTHARLFFTVLETVFLLGMAIPLRPDKSIDEKRELTKFPTFTFKSFVDGDYFKRISTWYADTFPFRDKLISISKSAENLYGVRDSKMVKRSNKKADEINHHSEDAAEQAKFAEQKKQEAEKKLEENLPDGTVYDRPELAGDVYIIGDRGFSLYYYSEDAAQMYSSLIDKVQKAVPECNVYDMVVPTTIGIMLDKDIASSLGSSNQKEALKYISDLTRQKNPNVKVVETFDTLLHHNAEYIYFRTDHHWTQTGAYYAYRQFAKAKGVEPTRLEDMQKTEYDGFIGTFYFSAEKPPAMKEHPDVIEAYISNATNDMTYVEENQNLIQWQVVSDVKSWLAGTKYSAYIGGDHSLATIDNPLKNDGENAVLIKDSYGNAFTPFLIDHYDKLFIVDYRLFHNLTYYQNSMIKFIRENGVKDVIILNNAESAGNENVSMQINSMFSL